MFLKKISKKKVSKLDKFNFKLSNDKNIYIIKLIEIKQYIYIFIWISRNKKADKHTENRIN